MTFGEILSAVYDECGYAASPATAIVTRMKRFVNEGVRAVLAEPGLTRLADSDAPYTFASVVSQARYVVPEAVARIRHISERTNDQELDVMSLDRYRRLDPDPTTTGTPTHIVPIGRVAVAVQPSDASQVFVKSTSASDGAGVTCFVEGIRTGGYSQVTSVAMNGVTAAALTGITDYIEITDFYLSANAVGTVTLLEDSGLGTELARITIGAKRPRYYGFYLWMTPAAIVTYYVDYRREVVDMVNDADEPPLSSDAHPMLIAYTVSREGEKLPKAVATKADARYARYLSRLKYQTQTLSDEIPVSGRGVRIGRSRLGGMYPADYYVRG